MKKTVTEMFRFAIVVGILCVVQSSPVKMSRPQAITAANLTQDQVETLIQENPPRPSILQPSDLMLPPSIPLYLPDPERNKSKDDYYLLAQYPRDRDDVKPLNDNPVRVPLSLDSYVQPPPLPSLDSQPINFQVEQAQKEKSSYSYNNRFDYYFPVKVVYDDNQKYGEKELQLMEMQPPIQNEEPNYYDVKPKKVPKKYQPNKKDVNHSKSYGRSGGDDSLVPIDNDGLVLDSEHTPFVTSQPVERFAPAPVYRDLTDGDLNTGEYIPKYKQEQNTEAIQLPQSSTIAAAGSEKINVHKLHESGESNTNEHEQAHKHNKHYNEHDEQGKSHSFSETGESSQAGKRVEYQMHGFEGPNSYKFGYDTGRGKERQFRVEQREADGSVKGEYGYIDNDGKMHLTKYSASEADGFKAEEVPT
ncbi:uncharacterized protein LOC116352271 [Contarinia nasturtii]|uniref:uncharacterized protein LOC116352271 n=1 Tax=Contarinia nasturtii TaxID=265458 RepID=UPI0012D44974|nr:uncharacterized protein LOC116352271 [Contarinia nasturtii]